MSGEKSTSRSRSKAVSQEERKTSEAERTFQESAWKPSWSADTPIKNINGKLDIQLGQFYEGRTYLLNNERPGYFIESIFDSDFSVNKQNPTEKWTKSNILLFSKKGDLGTSKNDGGIILTATTAKVYKALLLNRMRLETEKCLGKNQIAFFGEIDPQLHIFWLSTESL